MSSPFPGMDPYLEGSLFHDLHQALAAALREQLAPRIAPRYVARLETRYVVDAGAPSGGVSILYPDVDVSERSLLREPLPAVLEQERPPAEAQPPAAAPAPAEPVITPPLLVMWPRVKQVSVAIREAEGNALVTAIELLSPANKRSPGWQHYQHKRQTYLAGGVHLLEIDLLRAGRRIWEGMEVGNQGAEGEGLLWPEAHYYVLLSRAPFEWQVELWPIRLSDPLPAAAAPLRPPDADVALDLAAALAAIYGRARYDLSIDYSQPPQPPLSPADAAWAEATIARAAEG